MYHSTSSKHEFPVKHFYRRLKSSSNRLTSYLNVLFVKNVFFLSNIQ